MIIILIVLASVLIVGVIRTIKIIIYNRSDLARIDRYFSKR